MTDDLITWLRAQLDDDERLANRAMRGPWYLDYIRADDSWQLSGTSDPHGIARIRNNGVNEGTLRHIARHDSARVLAEVDAKRRILDVYQADVIDVSVVPGRPEWMHGAVPVEAHTVLRLLALPYADREGYREEWRP